MPPSYLNSDPVSDQNMLFPIRSCSHALYPILGHDGQNLYSFSDQSGLKSILFRAAHTCIADIGEYPRRMCRSVVNFFRLLIFSEGLSVKN